MINRTTISLTITRGQLIAAHVRAYLAQRDPLALLGLVVVIPLLGLALSASLWRGVPSPAVAAQQATAQPIFIIQTAQTVATPAGRAAAALPTAAPRLVVAFDSPNGIAFPDPIPEPLPSTWIARWGDGWIEVQWSPNPIWIRSADIGAQLADVRPVPQVTIAPAAEVAPAPVQAYQVTHAPQPASIVMTDEQRLAADRQFGLTDADFDRALAAHQAQQAAWCADKATEYCDMVRAAVAR